MSLLDDFLKGLPVNPLLREKIAELEAKYAATDTENSILKDDLNKAKAENRQLKEQIEKFAHKEDLDDVEATILRTITEADGAPWSDAIAERLSLHPQRAEYYLRRLTVNGYLELHFGGASYPDTYSLKQKAREYLIRHGVI